MREPPAGTARPRRAAVALFSLLLAAAIAALGLVFGDHVSLSLAYVVPIGLMAWHVGRGPALVVSLACAYDFVLLGTTAGHPEPTPYAPFWSAAVEFGFFAIIATTLDALRRSLDHQRSLATTDDVTAAPNRRAFYERATLEFERMRRSQEPLTLAFLDLDDFKEVNDRFGHRAGDDLLRSVAQRLAASLRKVDFVARLGGDEFAILLPDTNEEAARLVLGKLREELGAVTLAQGRPVTSSVGAVTFWKRPRSIDGALAEADALLYSVKASGKDGAAHRSVDTPAVAPVAVLVGGGHTRV